jgi:RHS repeat-associated protein
MTSSRATVLCQYHYDPLDRLTGHALTDTTARQRFYCKSRLANEIQGTNWYSIFQQDEQLLAQRQGGGDALDTALLATDQQRSVLQTLKANQPQLPIAYSPYGHRPAAFGLLSLLGFNGEHQDPLTGHYLLGNGYRAFNPALMRFNSPDSLSPFGKGGLNAYGYCAGNPINRTDPTGHFWAKDFIQKILQSIPSTVSPSISSKIEKAFIKTTKLTPDTLTKNGGSIDFSLEKKAIHNSMEYLLTKREKYLDRYFSIVNKPETPNYDFIKTQSLEKAYIYRDAYRHMKEINNEHSAALLSRVNLRSFAANRSSASASNSGLLSDNAVFIRKNEK